MAYIFVLLLAITLESLIASEKIEPFEFLSKFILIHFFIVFPIYLLSFVQDSLGGFSIRTFHMFTPLVENVHQYAMVAVMLPFVSFYCAKVFSEKKNIWKATLYTVMGIVFALIVISTYSAKAQIGLAVGVLAILVIKLGDFLKLSSRSLIVLFGFMGLGITSLFVLFYLDVFVAIFDDLDTNNSRATLYISAIELAFDRFLLGLGPGPQTVLDGEFIDTHQSFFTALLQGGVLGFICFSYLIYRVAFRLMSNPLLIGMFFALAIYAVGGDILRRAPIWIILILVYYLLPSKKPSNN